MPEAFSLTKLPSRPFTANPGPARILCGVSGWEHADWNGTVYPAAIISGNSVRRQTVRPKGFQPLAFLADRIDHVEVESSFHRIPQPGAAAFWAAEVAGNPLFRFTLQLHRDFTHNRELTATPQFAAAASQLANRDRLACLLAQLPGTFCFNAENRAHLAKLAAAFPEFPIVTELRHRSWSSEAALDSLASIGIGIANLDQPHAHCAMQPAARLIGNTAYFKFHGAAPIPGHFDFETPTSFEAATSPIPYRYSLPELASWLDRIRYTRRFAKSIYVSFANAAGACSLTNAHELESLLDPRSVSACLSRAA